MYYTLNSTLAEQARSNNGPKRAKAKEIFLGIDAHLESNQVAGKGDNSAIGAVQNLGSEGRAFQVVGRARVDACERCSSGVSTDATPWGPAHSAPWTLEHLYIVPRHREPPMCARFGLFGHRPSRTPRAATL